MITRTAVLLPQCICSPTVLWATAEPLWRRNQRRQPEQDPSVHDYHYLFSSGGKESGVDVAVCAHASVTLYIFFPFSSFTRNARTTRAPLQQRARSHRINEITSLSTFSCHQAGKYFFDAGGGGGEACAFRTAGFVFSHSVMDHSF